MGVCVSCKKIKDKHIVKSNTEPKKENNNNEENNNKNNNSDNNITNDKEKKNDDSNLKFYFTQSLNIQKLDTIKEEPSLLNVTTFNNYEQKNEEKKRSKFDESKKTLPFQKGENKKITYNITDTDNDTIIFGDEFVEENKDKLKLIIDDTKIDLCNKYLFDNIGEKQIEIIEESPITNMKKMFYKCESLISINNIWDLKNVTDTSEMFYDCFSLKTIENLKNWDMSNVKDASEMFYGCKNLESIKDVENWNMKNVNNIKDIFKECGYDDMVKDIFKKWDISFEINELDIA